MPFTVKLFNVGTTLTWQNILTEVPTANFSTIDVVSGSVTTTGTDNVTKMVTLEVSRVAPGTYNMSLFSPHNLINLREGVVIADEGILVNMSTLPEGNANDDVQITVADFSI